MKTLPPCWARSATQVRQELIDKCPNLKVVSRAGVGMDNIDVAHAREKGIVVLNTLALRRSRWPKSVFAHLFSIARNLQMSNREMPTRGVTEFGALKKVASGRL